MGPKTTTPRELPGFSCYSFFPCDEGIVHMISASHPWVLQGCSTEEGKRTQLLKDLGRKGISYQQKY